MLSTPVVLIVFNRPRQTRLTFEAIRQQRPQQLFIVADGPRPDHPTDRERCCEVQDIFEAVDWPCRIHRNIAETNLGCTHRVVSGLDWVFSQVDRAIILEDDCLPDPSFFLYCEKMLERYAEDDRVIHIAGTNTVPPPDNYADSYLFSRLVPIWGWATWRRGWAKYDDEMRGWPEFRLTDGLEYFGSQRDNVYRVFENHRAGAWDGRWAFTCFRGGQLSILPKSNLVTNTGFDEDATHTKCFNERHVRPSRALSFPLQHPTEMAPDRKYDIQYLEKFNGTVTQTSILRRIFGRLRSLMRR